MKTIFKWAKKHPLILIIMFIASVAMAAGVPQSFPTDSMQFGIGTSSADKVFTIDTNDGAGNPAITIDMTNKDFDLNKALNVIDDLLKVGDGTAGANKIFEMDAGLGAANGKVRYNISTNVIEFANDGVSFEEIAAASAIAGISEPSLLQNSGIKTSVAASALTLGLTTADGASDPTGGDFVKIAFRNVTITTGGYILRSVTAALSIVVPSGATLGHGDGADGFIYIYALDNAGTVELAVSTAVQDESSVQSTTLIDATADSNTGFYSTVARSNVPIRLISRVKSNQVTAGTWDLDVVENSPDKPILTDIQNSLKAKLNILDSVEYNICSGYITNPAGTPTLTKHSNCIDSVADNGVGNDIITITVGVFSDAPICALVAENPSFGRSCHHAGSTTTQLNTRCETGAGSAFDIGYHFLCMGKQ